MSYVNDGVYGAGAEGKAVGLQGNFLKLWAGEIITEFDRMNVMMPLHTVRTIKQGKSAQFPTIGNVDAGYIKPGEEITTSDVTHGERILTVDDVLYSSTFIYDVDDLVAHYDFRSTYTKKMSAELAKAFDLNVLNEALKAARGLGNAGDRNVSAGGTANGVIQIAGYNGLDNVARGTKLAQAIFEANAEFDSKNITGERFVVVQPKDYYALIQATDNINKDWGGMGSYADGTILKIGGTPIIKAPSFGVYTGKSGEKAHDQNWGSVATNDQTIALFMTKDTVGTVKMMDLNLQSDYEVRKQGTLFVARYLVGHGVLRNDSAIEIKAAA